MSFKKLTLSATLTTVVATMLAACGGGGSGNSSADTARLSIDLIDAPIDGAANVVVRISGLSMKGPDGLEATYSYCTDHDNGLNESQPESGIPEAGSATQTSENEDALADVTDEQEDDRSGDGPKVMRRPEVTHCEATEIVELDLLTLTGGTTAPLLKDEVVAAGEYNWIRLWLDETNPGYITLDNGEQHELTIPSSQNTGLKLVGGFSVDSDKANQFILDFDVRKSVHKAGNKYLLRPTLKLIKMENAEEQTLAGTWLTSDMGECLSPMAYVYEGVDVAPDDLGGIGSLPLTTKEFVADQDGTSFSYRVDFIEAGEYTVAYTCDGNKDEPDSDDDIVFSVTQNVSTQ